MEQDLVRYRKSFIISYKTQFSRKVAMKKSRGVKSIYNVIN